MADICTLVLLIDKDPVKGKCLWLGIKKRKQGVGKPNAPGGKLDPEDKGDVRECAVREVLDDAGLTIWSAELGRKRAVWYFYQAGVLIFECHVYVVTRPNDAWNCDLTWGEGPQETEQMGPWEKYPLNEIPYRLMMEADEELFGAVLARRVFQASVYYDDKLEHLERKIEYRRLNVNEG